MASSVIGALRVNLGLDSAQFSKGATEAQKRLKSMRTQFLAVAGVAAAFGAAISTAALKGAADVDRAAKAARRLGSSIGGYRALEMAAGEAGVSVSTLADAVQTMDREVSRGSKSATAALDKLGISASVLAGMDADQKLALVSDRVKELGLSTGQASVLLQDLGIRNREMLLAVMAGGDAFRDARRDVEDYGLAIGRTDSEAIELANDRIGRLGLIGQYVGQQLAVTLVPALGRLAEAMTDSLREGGLLRTVIDGLIGNFDRLGTYLTVVVAGFGVRYVAALALAQLATFSLAGAMAFLRGALIRSGIGLLIVGAGELVYQFTRLVKGAGGFGNAMGLLAAVGVEVWDRIKMGGDNLLTSIKGVATGIQAAFVKAFAWIMRKFADLTQNIANGVNNMFSKLNIDLGLTGIGSELADSLDAAASDLGGGPSLLRSPSHSSGLNPLTAPLTSLAALRDAMAEVGDETASTTDSVADLGNALDDAGGGGGGGGKKGGGGESEAKKEAEKTAAAIKALKTEYADLQATIGMTEQQQSVYNAIQSLGANATAGQRAEVEQLTLAIDGLESKSERLKETFGEVRDSMKSAFTGLVTGAKTLKSAIGDLLGKFADMLASRAFDALWGSLGGGSGGGGGWLGKIVSAIIPGFASGTNYAPGGLAMVNERGGEIMNLPRGTQIIPHDISKRMADRDSGAGGTVNINVSVDGANGDEHVISLVRQGVSAGLQQVPSIMANHQKRTG